MIRASLAEGFGIIGLIGFRIEEKGFDFVGLQGSVLWVEGLGF